MPVPAALRVAKMEGAAVGDTGVLAVAASQAVAEAEMEGGGSVTLGEAEGDLDREGLPEGLLLPLGER